MSLCIRDGFSLLTDKKTSDLSEMEKKGDQN